MRGFAGEGGWQGAFRRDWWSLRAVEGCMLAPWCDRHNHRGTLRGICADALACAALSACAAESGHGGVGAMGWLVGMSTNRIPSRALLCSSLIVAAMIADDR